MKKLVLSLSVLSAFLLGVAGCGGSGRGLGIVAAALAPSFKTSPQADTTGQTNVFTGTLGAGTTFTFAAIQNVTYNISISSNPSNQNVVVDVFDQNGNELKSKTVTTNGGLGYFHASPSEHVLVLVRPNDPINTSINITQLQVTGVGNFSQTSLSINLIVAGDDFSGFGNFNDLATATDRANLAQALVQKMQVIHDQNATGIKLGFEGFTLSTAQVRSLQPGLLDASGRTICHTQPEQVGATGYSNIDTADLDRWGAFGFPATDPVATRANGLDCFVIHHFATDGVVGLSPRPGTAIAGNGPGTALCVGAFVQLSGAVAGPRTIDEMAVVLTHEIGHFLGLLHTTTFSPSPKATEVKEAIDDGIGDTPPAGTIKDVNGDGVVGIGDGCADENYIMFYQSKATQSILSPTQIKILRTTLSSLAH